MVRERAAVPHHVAAGLLGLLDVLLPDPDLRPITGSEAEYLVDAPLKRLVHPREGFGHEFQALEIPAAPTGIGELDQRGPVGFVIREDLLERLVQGILALLGGAPLLRFLEGEHRRATVVLDALAAVEPVVQGREDLQLLHFAPVLGSRALAGPRVGVGAEGVRDGGEETVLGLSGTGAAGVDLGAGDGVARHPGERLIREDRGAALLPVLEAILVPVQRRGEPVEIEAVEVVPGEAERREPRGDAEQLVGRVVLHLAPALFDDREEARQPLLEATASSNSISSASCARRSIARSTLSRRLASTSPVSRPVASPARSRKLRSSPPSFPIRSRTSRCSRSVRSSRRMT